MRRIRFTMFKQVWRLIFVPRSRLYIRRSGEQLDGVCDVPDHPGQVLTEANREIHVRNDLDSEDMLETVLHELTHAAFPDKREDYVEHFARDASRLLVRLGYGRHDAQ